MKIKAKMILMKINRSPSQMMQQPKEREKEWKLFRSSQKYFPVLLFLAYFQYAWVDFVGWNSIKKIMITLLCQYFNSIEDAQTKSQREIILVLEIKTENEMNPPFSVRLIDFFFGNETNRANRHFLFIFAGKFIHSS